MYVIVHEDLSFPGTIVIISWDRLKIFLMREYLAALVQLVDCSIAKESMEERNYDRG